MLGTLYILFFALYLMLSFYTVKKAAAFARKYGVSAWIGGGLAGIVMYGLVFWDAMPTWYTHYQLCHAEAGLRVKLTPEQWAERYPERYRLAHSVVEGKRADSINSSATDIDRRVEIVNGLEYELHHPLVKKYAFNTEISVSRVIDKVTGDVLFEKTEFYGAPGAASPSSGANTIDDYKIWTNTGSCEKAYAGLRERFKYQGRSFSGLLKIIEGWSKNDRNQ